MSSENDGVVDEKMDGFNKSWIWAVAFLFKDLSGSRAVKGL